MKTICNCFLWIVILTELLVINLFFVVNDIALEKYLLAAIGAGAVAFCIVAIARIYKQAIRYEKTIQSALEDLYLRDELRSFKEFLESKKNESKDKEDEVEKHNGNSFGVN